MAKNLIVEQVLIIREALGTIAQIMMTENEDVKSNPVVEIPQKPAITVSASEKSLDEMTYNELKQLAKTLDVKAVGGREQLLEKIRPLYQAQESEPEEVLEEEEEEVTEELSLTQRVEEAVSEMSTEEILDYLLSMGIKAKGKRQALISAIVRAVEEGKIVLEDEDSEEEDSEEEYEESEMPVQSEDDEVVNTPARDEAMADFESEARNSEFTRKEIIEWLNEYEGTPKDKRKGVSDEELLELYIQYGKLFISDDGETIEEPSDAYYINGAPYCCGHQLQLTEDETQYVCSKCGTVYDAE